MTNFIGEFKLLDHIYHCSDSIFRMADAKLIQFRGTVPFYPEWISAFCG
jgi:hypothetical protein